MRHATSGEILRVELCPAVARLTDAESLQGITTAGHLQVRSVAGVDEARCSGADSRPDADDILMIRSIRFTGDSFVVTAERRRLSRYPFTWRERWVEVSIDAVAYGQLIADGWRSAH
jgi:hypothetical protein